MALVLKDRVRESSTSSGTGSITLGGAFTGYQTFASAVASGSTVYYTIHNTTAGNDGEWEVGVGTFTSPSTLSRDTVLSSSAGAPTKTNFSGSSILDVFITQPAEQAVYINQATSKVEAFGNGTNSISFVNVTADLFTGNASAISAINASNISSGTIDNARTSAASANGASTIVARDANGSFAGNVVTATTGSFTDVSGNGVALTAINASNISSGTIANARTTASDANGASTIVSRDANGSFTANIITANGSAISAINGSNVTTGTVANARTTAATANGTSTIVLRGTSGEFSAGAITGSSFTGDGSALSAINASNISSGTVNTARISGSYTGITGVGTLTAGTWNATAIGAQYGGTGSANLTAENVILGNGASAVKVVAPGTANNVLTSNGTTWISQAISAGGFDAGTRMIFAQNTAPTGWTKDTTNYNNHAMRIVTGTGGGTGGSVDFTTAFASQTPSGSVSISAISGSAGSTTLSTPQIPSHNHTVQGSSANGPPYSPQQFWNRNDFVPGTIGTSNTGGGGGHTHPFSFSSGSASFSGNAINLAVKYLDVITATKN